ncbi:uncharacterized protein FIBRA_03118 [Fibroporia radiculosa]|uniref:F-box domain-containing protein n=1 Tax=Fibroporia radiculosa TaxID=599839 RepID=J4GNA9_9APHY|nr:uncharacterized protein FIBRA_03118 [Fibroporia radiculosa]CCM01070.1 predicted protein [Fibroporia radiculosa]
MSSPPATRLIRLNARDNEPVSEPQAEEREMCCENGDNGRAKSLGSMPSIAQLDADMPLEHSIQLPIELWEKVIDVLADEWVDVLWRDVPYEARLRVLGRVCRGWYARCRFRTCERLDVHRMDKTEVYHLINKLNQDTKRCHAIRTVSFHFQGKSMSIFGTFAVCMAQKLPSVKHLLLRGCEWEPRQLHAQVFVHITLAFESVRMLELERVRVPSAVVFGRLLRALPRLSSLKCWDVSFNKHSDVAGRIWKLYPLRLDAAEMVGSDDVVDFLILIGAQLSHLPRYARSLEKCQELLRVTAESLSSLHIELLGLISTLGFPSDLPIDLTPAVNLRVFSISLYLKNLHKAAMVLSRAFLPKLTEITIVLIPHSTRALFSSIIRNTLNEVDKDSYALLDQVFSSRQYPALKRVTFKLHCHTRRSEVMEVISEESWGSHFASSLPVVHASGRLASFVSVQVEELV